MKKIKKQQGFTLIEILVVIGIIAILAAVVLIAINPARQFKQARNSQRTSNVNAILNAVGQFIADNKGTLPTGIPVAPAVAVDIPRALCEDIVPTYVPSLPSDPQSSFEGDAITNCADLDAGDVEYTIIQDANGRITVDAPSAELGETIQVTR